MSANVSGEETIKRALNKGNKVYEDTMDKNLALRVVTKHLVKNLRFDTFWLDSTRNKVRKWYAEISEQDKKNLKI